MLKATARTYKRGHDEQDYFKCPNCGKKQPVWNEEDITFEEVCCNCEQTIIVTYRRIHRKNF